VIVTHSTKSEAEEVDKVIIMQQGEVKLSGTPAELWNNPTYRQLRQGFMKSNHKPGMVEEGQKAKIKDEEKGKVVEKTLVKLITEEKSTGRTVDPKVYGVYLRAFGGYKFLAGTVVLSFLKICGDIGTSRWLAHWSNDVENGRDKDHELSFYLGIYAALSFGTLFLVATIFLVIFLASLSASKWYHSELKHGRLAMLAFLGFAAASGRTGLGATEAFNAWAAGFN